MSFPPHSPHYDDPDNMHLVLSPSGFPYMVHDEGSTYAVRFLNDATLTNDLWVTFDRCTNDLKFEVFLRVTAWELALTKRKRLSAANRAKAWAYAEESGYPLINDQWMDTTGTWAVEIAYPLEVC